MIANSAWVRTWHPGSGGAPTKLGEVLAVSRFVVASDGDAEFAARAREALAALAGRPGFRDGELARAIDDPTHWCLVTRWESVGAYRRALSNAEVRIGTAPLLRWAVNEPSGFEVLAGARPGGELTAGTSDLAERR
jgi:quinol monooxygenase YgiN